MATQLCAQKQFGAKVRLNIWTSLFTAVGLYRDMTKSERQMQSVCFLLVLGAATVALAPRERSRAGPNPDWTARRRLIG